MIDYKEDQPTLQQGPRLDFAVKTHMDNLVEQARQLAVKQAQYSLEEQVIIGKVLKGQGEMLSAKQDKQILDNIKSNISIIQTQSNELDQYLNDWDKRKEHLGLQHIDTAPKGMLIKEMHKLNSAIA